MNYPRKAKETEPLRGFLFDKQSPSKKPHPERARMGVETRLSVNLVQERQQGFLGNGVQSAGAPGRCRRLDGLDDIEHHCGVAAFVVRSPVLRAFLAGKVAG